MSHSPVSEKTLPFKALAGVTVVPCGVEPVGEIRGGLDSLESTLNRLECSISGLYRDLAPILSVCNEDSNECAKASNPTLSPLGSSIHGMNLQARRLEDDIDRLRQMVVL